MSDQEEVDFTLNDLMLTLFAMAVVLPMFALPAQILIEGFVWLRDAEFMNYDWYDFLGADLTNTLTSTDYAGVNKIVAWVLDAWVSIFPTGIAAFVYASLISSY